MAKKPGVTARQLPEIRAELVQWLKDPSATGGPAVWARGFDPATAAKERQAAADWALALEVSELFYVSGDMTHMALSAGLALPSYRLHPEDLPATHGLLVWEEPVTDAAEGEELVQSPVVAASWAVAGGGVHVRLWSHREDYYAHAAKGNPRAGVPDMTPRELRELRQQEPQTLVCMAGGLLTFEEAPDWLAFAPVDTASMSETELHDHRLHLNFQEQAERALVVTWLLMGQSLARREEVQAPRSSAKYIARINPHLLTAVRYVQLRHHSVPTQKDGEASGRAYQHRWIVRGHWRNHYYPSRKAHRPIWIDQHIKGPDGAPILDPEKLVNVLRR